MSLRLLSRSFRLPVTRLPIIPLTRPFSTSTYSFMDRQKPTTTAVVEPIISRDMMDEDFEATNSDADTTAAPQSQLRGMNTMSMADEDARERMEMSAKDDWTEEAEAMAQDIHTSRGMKPPVDTDYM